MLFIRNDRRWFVNNIKVKWEAQRTPMSFHSLKVTVELPNFFWFKDVVCAWNKDTLASSSPCPHLNCFPRGNFRADCFKVYLLIESGPLVISLSSLKVFFNQSFIILWLWSIVFLWERSFDLFILVLFKYLCHIFNFTLLGVISCFLLANDIILNDFLTLWLLWDVGDWVQTLVDRLKLACIFNLQFVLFKLTVDFILLRFIKIIIFAE